MDTNSKPRTTSIFSKRGMLFAFPGSVPSMERDISLELPAFDPSKHKELRAPRSPDAAGTHPEMLYCEFKGCSIMVYGKIAKCPVGSNIFPGWVSLSRPARLALAGDPKGLPKGKGKAKGKGDNKPDEDPPKGKGKGKAKGKGDNKPDEDSGQTEAIRMQHQRLAVPNQRLPEPDTGSIEAQAVSDTMSSKHPAGAWGLARPPSRL